MFENKNVKETLSEFNVDPTSGLSEEEASSRLITHGYNKLEEKKKKTLFGLFMSQFNDPMIFILIAAAILSVAISIYQLVSPTFSGDRPEILEVISDPAIILAVVVLNAIIGTAQESKAEKSLEALKRMSSPTSLVRRNNKSVEIKAEELVPGDIVILEEGRIVPADIRLIETHNLKTDESSLTGESLPVEKNADFVLSEEVGVGDRINCAYMSTPVVYGRGEGVVVSTGMNTETGKIAKMLSAEDNDTTPLQKKLGELSKFLGILTIVIVLAIFTIQMLSLFVFHKNSSINPASEIVEDFMLAISLAVAAVPEGLPAVVTIVLALGVQRMVKANTIVRKLPSVETLGAVSVVCSDKTGTLTQNKMTVVKAYINSKVYDKNELLDEKLHFLSKGLSLCSNASVDNGVFGDPTEIALVEFANKHNQKKNDLEAIYPRKDEYPFDSNRKMMSTKHSSEKGSIVFTKGAIDSILKCTTKIEINGEIRDINDSDKEEIMSNANLLSKEALRVLGLAYKNDEELSEENLIFVGLVGMIDPPREEAKEAVDMFKTAGITTVMITGDHRVTALAIASELGIAHDENQVMSGDEIDSLSIEQLQEAVKTVRVFARVSPQNKCDIITAIRQNGLIAAMTGDGVNDAPSLKKADIGIAMGINGTDVAKGAADMVLADDNFASIEKAVEEGRGIYANIKKTVLFLLGSNIAEVLTMFAVVVISLILLSFGYQHDLPMPLISIQILFINLITDSLPAVALGADEKEKGIMLNKPRSPKESLFSHGGIAILFGYGTLITIATLLAYFLAPVIAGYASTFDEIIFQLTENEEVARLAQTCAFSTLGFAELFHMLGMTSHKRSFVHNFKTKNPLIWVSFFLGIALQVMVITIPGVNDFFRCSPLGGFHWLLVLGLSISPLIAHEIVILIRFLAKKDK